MVTAIVKAVQTALRQAGRGDVSVEIIFPVAAEAVAAAPDSGLGIIPGVAGGEGCSTAGGCATCPFMKMNDLEALFDVCETVGTERASTLESYQPRKYTETIAGRTVADLGCEPILHMRYFQQNGVLPDTLIEDIHSR